MYERCMEVVLMVIGLSVAFMAASLAVGVGAIVFNAATGA